MWKKQIQSSRQGMMITRIRMVAEEVVRNGQTQDTS